MSLTKKQLGALATVFALAAGGAGMWFGSRDHGAKGIPAPQGTKLTEATILGGSNGVYKIRAHTWVSQYMFTTVCIGDVKYQDNKPLCNEVVQMEQGAKAEAGQTVRIFDIRGLGANAEASTMELPPVRPRQDMVQGPVSASVTRLIDGDTVEIAAETWPGHYVVTDIRVGEIDTPEKGSRAKCPEEAALAEKASAETKRLIGGKTVKLSGIKFEKYGGRVLANITTEDGQSVSENLVSKGLARSYGGKTKESWCKLRR